jgi:elongation factor Ts
MSTVDVTLVKKLRDMTMASLKDCKDALVASSGDLDAAQDWLKEKWLSSASKKADREMTEWVIKVRESNGNLLVVSFGCETDFVAKNELFTTMCEDVLDIIATETNTLSNYDSLTEESKNLIQVRMSDSMAKLWENMKVVDLTVINLDGHQAYTYLHNWGKITSIVVYDVLSEDAANVAKQVSLHIAAMNPRYYTIEQISQADLDAMKEELSQDLVASWKPAAMIEQIVAWKMNKHLADLVMMKQWYIWDETVSIEQILSWKATFVNAYRFAI